MKTAPLAVVVLPLALAACETFGGGSMPNTPPSFDGTWTGTTTRQGGGERSCPSRTPFVITVAGGMARGEVRSTRDRTVTVARFEGVVDADGRFAARTYYDGAQNDLSGTFSGDSFAGTIRNVNECIFNLRLSRG